MKKVSDFFQMEPSFISEAERTKVQESVVRVHPDQESIATFIVRLRELLPGVQEDLESMEAEKVTRILGVMESMRILIVLLARENADVVIRLAEFEISDYVQKLSVAKSANVNGGLPKISHDEGVTRQYVRKDMVDDALRTTCELLKSLKIPEKSA